MDLNFFLDKEKLRQVEKEDLEKGIEDLSKEVDAIIIIPNDKLLQLSDKNTNFKDAFASADDVLRQAVEGISDLITMPGIINVDFADIRAVMANAGSALMGVGKATGEKRAEEAAKMAINSPLLDLSINGAKVSEAMAIFGTNVPRTPPLPKNGSKYVPSSTGK